MEKPLVIKNKLQIDERATNGTLTPYMERDRIFRLIDDVAIKEADFLEDYTHNLTDHQFRNFANRYVPKRKKPTNVLLFAVLGLLAVGGIHRFYLGQYGLGILYLLTGGLFGIGTIVDIVLHQRVARKYNMIKANEELDRLDY
jgi:hypothetical protein